MTTFADPIEADDDINRSFKTAWDTGAKVIAGYAPVVRWQGVVEAVPNPLQAWVRVTIAPVMTQQVALADANGKRRDETSGIVTVQVFTPMSQQDGWLLAKRLGVLARKPFLRRSLSGKIWFRRARIIPLNPDGEFHRLNVIAEYEYDELN